MDKLFHQPPNNTYDNLQIDDESVSYITPPKISNDIISTALKNVNVDPKKIVVFDGTAGVGGDTICFSKIFGLIISVEIKEERYKMLLNNLCVYNVKNSKTFNDNFFNIMPDIDNIDVCYIDPPWGGSDYKKHSHLKLRIGSKTIDELVDWVFNKNIQKSDVKILILKLPINHDTEYLFVEGKKNNINIEKISLSNMIIMRFCNTKYSSFFNLVE
jgi:16S rRNA G966 N2-methylase RsmD